MVPEAPLEEIENGVRAAGPGWYVLNAREAPWFEGAFGLFGMLEPEEPGFDQVGVQLSVLRSGEPSGMYHGEDAQEDFLVLAGECLLLIEGEERTLRQWDFVHCPPWTEHIFVGGGGGPCVLLGVGARREGRGIRYPISEIAMKHGAGVEQETTEPRKAYERFAEDRPTRAPELPSS